jgi:deoxyribonuclease V
MILAVDVHYRPDGATGAGVLFGTWTQSNASSEIVIRAEGAAEAYAPGELYKRELPLVLQVLAEARRRHEIDVIVVDGYVTLGSGRPGLGARLLAALDAPVTVIGVGKSPFHGNTDAVPILRGSSARPLFVTAAGMDVTAAAELVRGMHGPHRLPDLLRRADQLARRG